jgi:hypothetical protein
VNVSIHAEATHRTSGRDIKVSENMFALLLDFAF